MRFSAVCLLLPALLAAPSVVACPVCDTGTGDQVRAAIFDGQFFSKLGMLLLPFPILFGVVAWACRTPGGAGPAAHAELKRPS